MLGVVNPAGPHHFASSSGSVNALNTAERGAPRARFKFSVSPPGSAAMAWLYSGADEEDGLAAALLAEPQAYALGWMFWLTRKRFFGS